MTLFTDQHLLTLRAARDIVGDVLRHPDNADEKALDELIELVSRATGATKADRLTAAVDKSLDAFWAAIAWHFPEARSNERHADVMRSLRRMALDAAAVWAELNLGETHVAEGADRSAALRDVVAEYADGSKRDGQMVDRLARLLDLATHHVTDSEERILCRECDALVHRDDATAILLDDNGPGEAPSCDGHVCPSCVELVERESRDD